MLHMILELLVRIVRRRAAGRGRLMVVAMGLAACSPTYDWREWQLEGDLALWMPCKPTQISRDVNLVGRSLTMTVHGCEAGGQSWAISRIQVADPAQVAVVQQALNESLAANLSTRLTRAQVPTAPGLAQAHELRHYELQGHGPDGSVVTADVWSFVHGVQVYQASVLQRGGNGEPADKDARDTYFGSLKFGR